MRVALSAIDQARFGIVCSRASDVRAHEVVELEQFCLDNRVALLIARCDAADAPTIHALEAIGCHLMDSLIDYRRALEGHEETDGTPIRPICSGEEGEVVAIALEAFHDFVGHYHADRRLDPRLCDETYADWALRSCTDRSVADEVLVYPMAGCLRGFIALRREGEEVRCSLIGVARAQQGRGIGRALMKAGMHWAQSGGATRMAVQTQLANVMSQRLWVSLGFVPDQAEHTFHRWFERGS